MDFGHPYAGLYLRAKLSAHPRNHLFLARLSLRHPPDLAPGLSTISLVPVAIHPGRAYGHPSAASDKGAADKGDQSALAPIRRRTYVFRQSYIRTHDGGRENPR